MKLKVIINKETCIGAQSCVIEDPDHFIIDEKDGRAALKKDNNENDLYRELTYDVTEEQKEKLLLAAQLCPTQAISIYDEKGAKLFPY